MCKVINSVEILNISSRIKVYINASKEIDEEIRHDLGLGATHEAFLRLEKFRDQVGRFPVLLGLIQIFVQYASTNEDMTQLIKWSKEQKIEHTTRALMPTLLKNLIENHELITAIENTPSDSHIRSIFYHLIQVHCPDYLNRLPLETVDSIPGHVSFVSPSASFFGDPDVCLDFVGGCIKPSP